MANFDCLIVFDFLSSYSHEQISTRGIIIEQSYYNLHSEIRSKFIYILTKYNQTRTKMFDEQDNFYKQLPFTLPPEQAKPNYLIFGTGLQQCLLAAHYSKIHMKPGLVLDCEKTYGASIKTVTLKELYGLGIGKERLRLYNFLKTGYEQKNQQFMESLIQNKEYKGYNIDIEPSFFFGSSLTCELLKQADMDKYMDFRIVANMLHYTPTHGLTNIPLSKGKIFSSSTLSLLQKKLLLSTFHSLIQLYNKYANISQDQNSTKQFDKQFGQVDQKLYKQFIQNKEQYFIPFLQKLTKKNQKIMDYVVYVIGNYQYDYKRLELIPEWDREGYRLGEFVGRVGKFVRSCGVYGECPYLYVDNGIGDVPQAYSRIASIYLSTYILHPRIQINKLSTQIAQTPTPPQNQPSSQTDSQAQAQNSCPPSPCRTYSIETNLSPSGPIKTQKIFISPSYYNLVYKSEQDYHREYILRTIVLCQKLGNQEECPAIIYLTDINRQEDTKGRGNPVFLFVFDHVSHSCPAGKILYQFEEVIGQHVGNYQDICQRKVNKYLQVLQKSRGQNFKKSINYLTCYVRQKRYPKKSNSPANETTILLKDHSGIDLDSQYANFKQIVGEQSTYFRVINKEGIPQHYHQEDQEFGGDQTVGLIQRLQAIDINKQSGSKQKDEEKGEEDEQQVNVFEQQNQTNKQANTVSESAVRTEEQQQKQANQQKIRNQTQDIIKQDEQKLTEIKVQATALQQQESAPNIQKQTKQENVIQHSQA